MLNPRAALLSNHEVLTWLRELESEHLLRTKTALRVKKEEEAAVVTGDGITGPSTFGASAHLEASENLRTVEIEVKSFDIYSNRLFHCSYVFFDSIRLLVIWQQIILLRPLNQKKASQNSLKILPLTISPKPKNYK